MIRRALFRRLVALAVALPAAAAEPCAQVSVEYNVKAALLLNFARFIEWPEAAFADARAPVNICVFGSNPFGDALERSVQGEEVGHRPIVARQVNNIADAGGCHLLFFPSGTEARAAARLQPAGSHAVTVGESRRFEDMGGAVNFVLDGGRVRFNVNLQPVEERGVRISARMLNLASRVARATPSK